MRGFISSAGARASCAALAICWTMPAMAAAQDYDLTAQNLAEALRSFALQANERILFREEAIRGRTSHPVRGRYEGAKALDLMLQGTGARAVRTGSGVYLIQLSAAGQARAAAPLPPPPPSADPIGDTPDTVGAGAEIVVTAQKRAERVQDVPISIMAFGNEKMKSANVTAVADLPRLAPGLQFSQSAFSASSRLSIRGIGSAGNTAIEPSVAAFVDGIYVPRPGSIISSFVDMESVEVLRGPQGTLFGRNASVGAVSFHTASPRDEFLARAGAELGTGDRYKLDGMINVPLGNGNAIRVAGVAELFGGLYHNRLDGRQIGGFDTYSGRASGKFALGDNIDWVVKADYTDVAGDGYSPLEFDQSSVDPTRLAIFRAKAGGQLGDADNFNRTINAVANSNLHDRNWGLGSDLNIGLGNDFAVRLLSGYRDWKNDNYVESVDWLPRQDIGLRQSYRSRSLSNEVQLISPKDVLLDGRLSFVLGLYQFRERYDIGEQLTLYPSFCTAVLPPAVSGACLADPKSPATDLAFSQVVNSFAAYGQATFKLTDRLEAVLGGRWTKERKSADFDQVDFNRAATAFRAQETGSYRISDDRPNYRLGLNFKPSSRQLLFASYSTGFKSGGIDAGGSAVVLGARRPFKAETTRNYELGAKTSWLDNSFIFNITFYRLEISGFQDRAYDGVSFSTRNAGSLRNQGFEIDGAIRPDHHLSFDYAIAYLDSQFTSYPNAPGLPGFGGTQNLKGRPNNFSPKWTVTGGAQLDGGFGAGDMSWSLRSDLSFVSDAYIGSINDGSRQAVQDGYMVLGARATLFGPDKRWSVALFGKNLLDAKYCGQRSYQFLDALFGLRDPVSGNSGILCNVPSQRTFGAALSWQL